MLSFQAALTPELSKTLSTRMLGFYYTYLRAHPGYLVGWNEIVSVLAHGEHTIRRWPRVRPR